MFTKTNSNIVDHRHYTKINFPGEKKNTRTLFGQKQQGFP